MDAHAPQVTLVHDWLTGMRGGEKCLEVLCRRWPHARLFTLLHQPGSVSRRPSNGSGRAPASSTPSRRPALLPLPAAAHAGGRGRAGGCRRPTWSSASATASPRRVRAAGRACRTSATASRPCATPGTCASRTSAAGCADRRPGCSTPSLACSAHWDRRTAARVTHFIAISRDRPRSASPNATAATAPSSTRPWIPTSTARPRCRARTSTSSCRRSPRTSGSTWRSRRAGGCGGRWSSSAAGQDEDRLRALAGPTSTSSAGSPTT